jgi:hypothetical protein
MELAIAVALGVAETNIDPPQPLHIGAQQNGRSIPMASSLRDITVGGRMTSLFDTLRGYFVRYRLALYLSSAAAVALGVVLNWNWLTAAGLLRVVAVLPCALMMFSCIRHGTRRSDGETALPDKT